MNRFTLAACAGLLAVMVASPSFAADMPRPSFLKAPAYAASFNWTGVYVGLNGGYGFGTSNWTNTGGTIGYSLQTGLWVWGMEADIDYSWMKGTDATACCETKNDWLGTARGRVGYAMDRLLPYVTGGAAFGDVKMTSIGFGSETATKIGWTAGAGLEYAVMGAWSAKVEYLYADMGKATCNAATCGLDTDVTLKTRIVRAGVNYHL